MPSPARFPVAGTMIADTSLDDAVARLAAMPGRGERAHVHFCTTHSVVEAADDATLQDIFNAPDSIAFPDGMPLVWVGRAMGRDVSRVCGPDLMPALIDRARETGARHYFYGGAPGVAERLAERLSERFPGMVTAGVHSPPFRALSPEEDAAEIAMIDAAAPDFVWIGLGAPKQDRWAAQHLGRLRAPVLLAVGAAFDFHSGGLRRAPAWMQRSGLEWLYRLYAEPRRLFRRYAVANTRFVILVMRQAARRRLRRPSAGT